MQTGLRYKIAADGRRMIDSPLLRFPTSEAEAKVKEKQKRSERRKHERNVEIPDGYIPIAEFLSKYQVSRRIVDYWMYKRGVAGIKVLGKPLHVPESLLIASIKRENPIGTLKGYVRAKEAREYSGLSRTALGRRARLGYIRTKILRGYAAPNARGVPAYRSLIFYCVADLPAKGTVPTVPPEWITVAEASMLLQVSSQYLYKQIAHGKLSAQDFYVTPTRSYIHLNKTELLNKWKHHSIIQTGSQLKK